MSKLIITLYILTTSAALVALKYGTKAGPPLKYLGGSKLQFNLTPYSVVGIILYGLSFALYVYLISKYELGYIIPLLAAFVYILVFLASFYILNEVFTFTKVVGIALILIGLIFLNLNK